MLRQVPCTTVRMFQHKSSFACSSPEFNRNIQFWWLFYWRAGSFALSSPLLGSRPPGCDCFEVLGPDNIQSLLLPGSFIVTIEHCIRRLQLGNAAAGVRIVPYQHLQITSLNGLVFNGELRHSMVFCLGWYNLLALASEFKQITESHSL